MCALSALGHNLCDIEPDAISDTKVLPTLFGGEPVHGDIDSI